MNDAPEYRYNRIFDDRKSRALRREPKHLEIADRAAPDNYVFDEDIRLAINLALATGRPLLVSGPSGSGKSSLAQAVAELAGWSYCERAITSRLPARDLLYEIDHLKRLQDAEQDRLKGDEQAIYHSRSAFLGVRSGTCVVAAERYKARQHHAFRNQAECPPVAWFCWMRSTKRIPMCRMISLLPFGQLSFEIAELGQRVACIGTAVPLLVLTTNGERDLPPAFLRRCVSCISMESRTRRRAARGFFPSFENTN